MVWFVSIQTWSHTALLCGDRKESIRASPNFSLKAAWTGQWPFLFLFISTRKYTQQGLIHTYSYSYSRSHLLPSGTSKNETYFKVKVTTLIYFIIPNRLLRKFLMKTDFYQTRFVHLKMEQFLGAFTVRRNWSNTSKTRGCQNQTGVPQDPKQSSISCRCIILSTSACWTQLSQYIYLYCRVPTAKATLHLSFSQ